MKKLLKKLIIIVIVIAAIFLSLYLFARYGWRLSGFSACSNTVMCTEATIENGEVHIKGGTADSISSYVGYIYKVEDGTLYIGAKFNLLLGFGERDGGFDIRFQPKEEFHQIYFKGSNGVYEKPVWTQ